MSRNSKIIIATVVVVALAVVSLVAVKGTGRKASETYVANKPPVGSQPATPATPGTTAPTLNPTHTTLILSSGKVGIDAQPLADGQARFYTVQLPAGNAVRFFVVRDGTGIYRAAADACQVCYEQRKGFHQEGSELVCNNCGNRYPLGKIATEKGGCNPGPINPGLSAASGTIYINQAELEQISDLF
jgi:uncharacterized membrane protein